jgi:uncharacterized protein (TIGR03067 family)
MYWQVLTAVAALGVPSPDDQRDIEKLQGAWAAVSMEFEGKKTPPEEIKLIRMTIKDDALTLWNGNRDEHMTFKIDPGKKPKTIDFMVKRDMAKDLPIAGIYELKGDELSFCYVKAGIGDRPANFVVRKGTSHALMVFKRDKKDK